jgi:hypothetical protein
VKFTRKPVADREEYKEGVLLNLAKERLEQESN